LGLDDPREKVILSLFDYTGNWSKPYADNWYSVVQIDIQHGDNIMTWDYKKFSSVYGILAAVPCTDFAISGARHFAQKDADGTTQRSIEVVYKTLEIINYFNPTFWVVENPMSRIHKCVPELGEVKYKFNPCDFAGYTNSESDRYNKTTWLWGKFNAPVKKRIEPLTAECPQWRKYGGKSLKTKNARSATPLGFAQAFYEANR
jgi:hypothetical protein